MLNLKIDSTLINPKAIEVCRILSSHGYQAYIVGGCVRDLLLNQIPKDYDITTDATPSEIMSIFPINIPTGIKHGTITVVMGQGVENHFEVTTFRIESEYKDGRHPDEVMFVMNIEQDLARRDLTINAIAFDPLFNILMDPYDGILDIKNGFIRAVGNPDARFKEDGLRIMRAARFAARFGYAIESKTQTAMANNLSTLQKVSIERIKDELCKTLMTNRPSYGINCLLECGALTAIAPIFTDYALMFKDKLNDCLANLETRVAMLFANITTKNAYQELLNLKFSNKEIKRICFLLDLLDKYNDLSQKDTVNAYKSFMAVLKNHSPDNWTYTLNEFVKLTQAMGLPFAQQMNKYKEEQVLTRKELNINGDDLINLHMQGPRIKNVLDACYLEVLKRPENNNKVFLLEFAATV